MVETRKEVVKKKVKILDAQYVEEADSILIIGECEQGKLRHQIHSNCFDFGKKDKAQEMKKTAELMKGKSIWMVFDPNLDGKIDSHISLKY